VLHIPGGPGGSGIAFLHHRRGAGEDLVSLAEQGDLIVLDPRGTGYSEPAICKGVTEVIAGGESRFREDMQRCLSEAESRGIELDALSTWHQAMDIRDLRRALGYERWNLWGLSYGTRAAAAVAQVDAEGVRAIILDSTSPAHFPTGLAYGLRSSLNAVGQACFADPRCAEDVGDLAGRLVAAITAYEADPVEMDGFDERLFPGGRFSVDDDRLASTLFGFLYSSANYDDLPSVLAVLARHDDEAIRQAVRAQIQGSAVDPLWGGGTALVTTCRWSFPPPDSLVAWRNAEPVIDRWTLRADFLRNAQERCEQIYRIDPDASVRPLSSDIPAMILSGAADPVTPPSFAHAVASGLSRATVIEVPYTGHNVIAHLNAYSPGCGTALMAAFIADPAAGAVLPCPNAIQPPHFVTRLRETPRISRFFVALRQGQRPVLPVVAVVGLVWAVLAYPLAAIGRRIDGRQGGGATRIRAISWIGALLSLGAVAAAALVLHQMATRHQLSLAAGLLPQIAWAGWLAVLGVLTSAVTIVLHFTALRQGAQPIGTTLGVVSTATVCALLLAFLIQIGAGPL
jgi:pimeloyl-ACP methyl ester carboxylesterase